MNNRETAAYIRTEMGRVLPEAALKEAPPLYPDGFWHLDFRLGERVVSVQIENPKKIAITVLPSDYGVEAEEYQDDAGDAVIRIRDALETTSQASIGQVVRRLREMAHISQASLAETLGLQQPAVSKLERRGDVTVAQLLDLVDLLQGHLQLEIRVGEKRVILHTEPRDKETVAAEE